jgi:hypothetical protein
MQALGTTSSVFELVDHNPEKAKLRQKLLCERCSAELLDDRQERAPPVQIHMYLHTLSVYEGHGKLGLQE